MEKLKQEEEEKLCILAEPLRHYLMKYIFPTLTEALIEVAKLRPEDPVDFLVSISFPLLFVSVPLLSRKYYAQLQNTVLYIYTVSFGKLSFYRQLKYNRSR